MGRRHVERVDELPVEKPNNIVQLVYWTQDLKLSSSEINKAAKKYLLQ